MMKKKPKPKTKPFTYKTEIYETARILPKDNYMYIAERVWHGLFNINLTKKEDNLYMEKAINELLVLKNEILSELEIRISEAAAKIREESNSDIMKINQALEILGYVEPVAEEEKVEIATEVSEEFETESSND